MENGTYPDLPPDWVSRVGAAGYKGTSPNLPLQAPLCSSAFFLPSSPGEPLLEGDQAAPQPAQHGVIHPIPTQRYQGDRGDRVVGDPLLSVSAGGSPGCQLRRGHLQCRKSHTRWQTLLQLQFAFSDHKQITLFSSPGIQCCEKPGLIQTCV